MQKNPDFFHPQYALEQKKGEKNGIRFFVCGDKGKREAAVFGEMQNV